MRIPSIRDYRRPESKASVVPRTNYGSRSSCIVCRESGSYDVELLPVLAALWTFCHFINGVAERADGNAAAAVLNDPIKATDDESYLSGNPDTRDPEARWDNVGKFAGWRSDKTVAGSKTLLEPTRTIALMNVLERRDQKTDAVSLGTMHAAKGLEFPFVFLAGAEENILWHRESINAGKVEEQRRLTYMAITRAERQPSISHCSRRRRGKKWQARQPRRFIAERAPTTCNHTAKSAIPRRAGRKG